MPLYYLLVGRRMECAGVHEHWGGFDRSISGCVCLCVTTMLYSPSMERLTQKNKNTKRRLANYLKISFDGILNIRHRSGPRAPDPKTDSATLDFLHRQSVPVVSTSTISTQICPASLWSIWPSQEFKLSVYADTRVLQIPQLRPQVNFLFLGKSILQPIFGKYRPNKTSFTKKSGHKSEPMRFFWGIIIKFWWFSILQRKYKTYMNLISGVGSEMYWKAMAGLTVWNTFSGSTCSVNNVLDSDPKL